MICRPYFRLTVTLMALGIMLAGCFSGVPAQEVPIDTFTATSPPQATPTDALETTPEATATPVALVPLSIETLRRRTYEGSDFVVEQVLDPGVNYDRYVASYQSDGLKIYALLTIPRGERPATGFPVIIFNHGYIPPAQYRTTERYVAYADAFAREGYIVVKSDYRGHGSSEGEPESAYGSPAYVVDVLNALASARRHPDADPNRVGMWGHSMGGYITLRAMVADQGIRAGVIWAGVVASYDDLFETWFSRGGSTRRSGWRDELVSAYGTPAENPAFWQTLSANSYLADLSGPIQLHHGTSDTSVPFAYSVRLVDELRAAGHEPQLFLYTDDDHNISRNLDDALTRSVAFFNLHVKGSLG